MANKVKISKRIETIARSINPEFPEVWDLCCDHGKIGTHILKSYPKEQILTVHFNDKLVHQIDSLRMKLSRDYGERVQLHSRDARQLKISSLKASIIIAGIGGDLMLSILESLFQIIDYKNYCWVLSPHSKQLKVRAYLREKNLKLDNEELIFDSGVYYQILTLQGDGKGPSNFGENWWGKPSEVILNYYSKELKYLTLKNKKTGHFQNELSELSNLLGFTDSRKF